MLPSSMSLDCFGKETQEPNANAILQNAWVNSKNNLWFDDSSICIKHRSFSVNSHCVSFLFATMVHRIPKFTLQFPSFVTLSSYPSLIFSLNSRFVYFCFPQLVRRIPNVHRKLLFVLVAFGIVCTVYIVAQTRYTDKQRQTAAARAVDRDNRFLNLLLPDKPQPGEFLNLLPDKPQPGEFLNLLLPDKPQPGEFLNLLLPDKPQPGKNWAERGCKPGRPYEVVRVAIIVLEDPRANSPLLADPPLT